VAQKKKVRPSAEDLRLGGRLGEQLRVRVLTASVGGFGELGPSPADIRRDVWISYNEGDTHWVDSDKDVA